MTTTLNIKYFGTTIQLTSVFTDVDENLHKHIFMICDVNQQSDGSNLFIDITKLCSWSGVPEASIVSYFRQHKELFVELNKDYVPIKAIKHFVSNISDDACLDFIQIWSIDGANLYDTFSGEPLQYIEAIYN